jgi:hypothetical protein
LILKSALNIQRKLYVKSTVCLLRRKRRSGPEKTGFTHFFCAIRRLSGKNRDIESAVALHSQIDSNSSGLPQEKIYWSPYFQKARR